MQRLAIVLHDLRRRAGGYRLSLNHVRRTPEAQFKGMSFDKVKLLKRDGQEITIPLEKLSAEDQEWIGRKRY